MIEELRPPYPGASRHRLTGSNHRRFTTIHDEIESLEAMVITGHAGETRRQGTHRFTYLAFLQLRLSLCFRQRFAGRHARSRMPDIGQPGIGEQTLTLMNQRQDRKRGVLRLHGSDCARQRLLRSAPGAKDLTSDQSMTGSIQMDAVARQREIRLRFTTFRHIGIDRGMDIDGIPAGFPLRYQPLRVLSERRIVSLEGLTGGIIRLPRRTSGGAYREGVEGRRSDEIETRPCLFYLCAQSVYTLLIFAEALGIEGLIDAIVHPIAGDDQIGLGLFQRPVETLRKIRTGKCAARMVRLRQTRYRLAGQSDIDEFEDLIGRISKQVSVDGVHIPARIRDAIPQKHNAPNAA